MKTKDLLAFTALCLAWGSSFLWIKIALQEIGPFQLVGLRILFGLVGLLLVLVYRRSEWPHDRRVIWALLLLGLTNTALPFLLISWAEQFIDSAVASVLNSSMPLFTMLIAHVALSDDRMTRPRVLGLLIGFAGVIVLAWRDIQSGLQINLLAQGAMLAAVLFYAGSTVFARRNTKGIQPVIQAMVPLVSANLFIWALAPILEGPLPWQLQSETWVAVAWLGLIGSCLAYVLYFYLIHAIGPTRVSMVTYAFPVVGIFLGVVFLQEALNIELILGAVLVLTSLVVVNRG